MLFAVRRARHTCCARLRARRRIYALVENRSPYSTVYCSTIYRFVFCALKNGTDSSRHIFEFAKSAVVQMRRENRLLAVGIVSKSETYRGERISKIARRKNYRKPVEREEVMKQHEHCVNFILEARIGSAETFAVVKPRRYAREVKRPRSKSRFAAFWYWNLYRLMRLRLLYPYSGGAAAVVAAAALSVRDIRRDFFPLIPILSKLFSRHYTHRTLQTRTRIFDSLRCISHESGCSAAV